MHPPESITLVRTSDAFLFQVLTEWIRVQDKYIAAMDGVDTPWWFNETALVGFLAAATWRSGGVALQEYRTQKLATDGRSRPGRADLYLYGASNEYFIEAKTCSVRLPCPPQEALERITASLNQACENAATHRQNKGRHLGAVFMSTRLSPTIPSDFGGILKDLTTAIQGLDPSALAATFPASTRTLRSGEGDLVPGGFLLLKAV